MTLIDIIIPDFVDDQLHQAIIDRLSSCASATSTYALDTIFVTLLRGAHQQSSPSVTYRAMLGDSIQTSQPLDERSIRWWFWSGLCTPTLYPVVLARIPDQPHLPTLNKALLALLAPYPIDVGLQTWIASSIHWLQICNTTWFFNEIRESRPPSEADIPRHIAGMMALLYY